jgi:hypothetical protein
MSAESSERLEGDYQFIRRFLVCMHAKHPQFGYDGLRPLFSGKGPFSISTTEMIFSDMRCVWKVDFVQEQEMKLDPCMGFSQRPVLACDSEFEIPFDWFCLLKKCRRDRK